MSKFKTNGSERGHIKKSKSCWSFHETYRIFFFQFWPKIRNRWRLDNSMVSFVVSCMFRLHTNFWIKWTDMGSKIALFLSNWRRITPEKISKKVKKFPISIIKCIMTIECAVRRINFIPEIQRACKYTHSKSRYVAYLLYRRMYLTYQTPCIITRSVW